MVDNECTILYKILTQAEEGSLPERLWKGTALDKKDGYIHTSTSKQVSQTLERFFGSESGVGDTLYLAVIPRSNVKQDELKIEGEGFPHIYGTIDPSIDISRIISIQRDTDTGKFSIADLEY